MPTDYKETLVLRSQGGIDDTEILRRLRSATRAPIGALRSALADGGVVFEIALFTNAHAEAHPIARLLLEVADGDDRFDVTLVASDDDRLAEPAEDLSYVRSSIRRWDEEAEARAEGR